MAPRVLSILICLGILPLARSVPSDGDLARLVAELEAKVHSISQELDDMKSVARQRQLGSQNVFEGNLTETINNITRDLTTATDTTIPDMKGAMDHIWLLVCGALVMLMQAGFAMVEAGSCRVKNVQNIMMKNLVDVCLGTFCWWSFGWTLAYGCESDDGCLFAGTGQYFGKDFASTDATGNITPNKDNLFLNWFFQWAFCSAAATIVSGGVAERVKFHGYVIYTFMMTTTIYPIVVSWMWSSGWLTAGGEGHLNGIGFNDFAGSGIVHMTGGVGALVGAIIVGPRKGRFENPDDFAPHSLPLIVLGTFILWFGWYGFNCGSTLGLSSTSQGQLAAAVAMNTTLSAASGGLTVLLLKLAILKKYDVGAMCNGILAGLVSITAGCGNMECGSAFAAGIIGGFVCVGASTLLKLLKIDDPVDAFAVHGAAGAWGVLAACLFDWGAGFNYYNGFNGGFDNAANAVTEETEGQWVKGFAAAVVEILIILVWVGGLSTLIFLPLRLLGLLRATDEDQEAGMDVKEHSPNKAYEGGSIKEGIC